jgi:hypothetical protein
MSTPVYVPRNNVTGQLVIQRYHLGSRRADFQVRRECPLSRAHSRVEGGINGHVPFNLLRTVSQVGAERTVAHGAQLGAPYNLGSYPTPRRNGLADAAVLPTGDQAATASGTDDPKRQRTRGHKWSEHEAALSQVAAAPMNAAAPHEQSPPPNRAAVQQHRRRRDEDDRTPRARSHTSVTQADNSNSSNESLSQSALSSANSKPLQAGAPAWKKPHL